MRAKVKISIISTGQEFLLLVAKMNLKGILVFSPQIIPPNSELLLELKLGKENPILLKGFVHKVSEDSSTKKGMVIAFLNPSAETKKSIQKFIGISQGSAPAQKTPKPKKKVSTESKTRVQKPPKKKVEVQGVTEEVGQIGDDIIQPEKTVIVDNTLPALSLQSPDNSRELQVSTVDEENVHHAGDVAGGETKHVQIHDTLTRRKKPKRPFRLVSVYRALGIVFVIVGLVLFFRHGVGWIESQFGIKLMPEQAKNNRASSQPLPSITPQVPNAGQKKGTKGSLDTITIDDQGDFLKLTFLGDGNYNDFTVEKIKNPHRLEFTFGSLNKLNAKMPMAINNNPVKNIEAKIENEELHLTIFMSGKSFMEFDAKPYPHTMDIFFYRE